MTYDETLSPEENTQRVKDAMQKLLDAARANYPTLSGADLEFLPASMGGTAPTLEEAEADDARIAAERRRKRAEKAAAASSSQG